MIFHHLSTVENGEYKFGIAGDWHGNWRWAANGVIPALGKAGVRTIFQLGDFGIWPGPGGEEFLGKIRKALEKYDMTLYVTLGNHEDYDQVDALEPDEQGLKWPRHNIALFPRVFHFQLNHYRLLSLGGAPSIDREWRTPGTEWWPQEMLTEEEVDEAIAGGQVDIMFAHDAPDNGTRAVQQVLDGNPMGWSREALDYAALGRNRMTRAVQAIKPQVFMHGHYHVLDHGHLHYNDGTYPGVIYSFNPDGLSGNAAVWDTHDIYEVRLLSGQHALAPA
jgi:hypothetical protein